MNGKNIEDDIRTVAVSGFVSPVSKIREVRETLVDLQREMARDKGVVMDGRDIGTVVFPDADIKIYLTAKPEIRAQRRYDESNEKGMEASSDEIHENIMDCDYQDSPRDISPPKKAEDAIELDNSSMTPEEQMAWFKDLLEEKFGDMK
jgi:cytidylate kinase